MKQIPLTQGRFALVDDADYEWLMQWNWHLQMGGRGDHPYAARSEGLFKNIKMHRVIIDAPSGMQVDHINGDGLDNRRENLRLCTNSENARNSRLSLRNSTGFKGVHWDDRLRKYETQITIDRKQISLGYFSEAEEAARAYDQEARKRFGEFARTNF